MSPNNAIRSFLYTDGKDNPPIVIHENATYLDALATINTLNIIISTKNNDDPYSMSNDGVINIPCDIHDYNNKYFDNGQTIHRLANDYYTKEYDGNITSYCSPQIYDMLKDNAHAPVLEFYTDKSNIAYGINKQYTDI